MSFKNDFDHSQELFESALDEFAEKGYELASLNTILENANMSKGQFYYHFKNKEALYFKIVEILIEKKKEFLAGVMNPEDFQKDIFSIFEAQIKHGLAFAKENPEINRFSESFLKEKGNPIYKKIVKKYNLAEDDAISALIDVAYQKGDFSDDLPPVFIKKIIGNLFAHVSELIELDREGDLEQELGHFITFMRTGLMKRNSEEKEKK